MLKIMSDAHVMLSLFCKIQMLCKEIRFEKQSEEEIDRRLKHAQKSASYFFARLWPWNEIGPVSWKRKSTT